MRASAVVKRYSALVFVLLRLAFQAATSLVRVSLSGTRRSRHCDARMPSSNSAMFSQLPCLGGKQRHPVEESGALPFFSQLPLFSSHYWDRQPGRSHLPTRYCTPAESQLAGYANAGGATDEALRQEALPVACSAKSQMSETITSR